MLKLPPQIHLGFLPGLLVGGTSLVLNVAIHWAAVFGPRFWAIPGVEFLLTPVVVAVLVLPFAGLVALFPRARGVGVALIVAATVTIGLTLAGVVVGWQIREAGFARLARQARPLVEAIASYAEAHHSPPDSLELLPAEVRQGLPAFTFTKGLEAQEHFDGNPWALSLDAGTGLMNWDQFIYYPLQNYPTSGHGSRLKRIEEWAYVYE